MVEQLRTGGHPIEQLVRGTQLPVEALTDESHWVTWDEFVTVLENIEELVGEQRTGELVAGISRDPLSRSVRASLSFAVSPAQLYRLLIRWLGPNIYPAHRATTERRSPGVLFVVLEVPEHHRPSEAFFRTSHSAFRYAPRILGLPDAQVEARIGSHRAEYVIRFPPSGSFVSRIRRVVEVFTSSRSAIDALAEQQAELHRSYEALTESYEALRERGQRLEAEIEGHRRTEAALRESEEQLLRSQRMEAMGELAGGIAHDFNNLMTTVLGYASVLSDEQATGPTLEAGLHEIRGAAKRATRLTSQLLAFSRRQVLQPRVLDLNEIVSDMETMLGRLLGEHIELRTELASDLPAIEADPGQVEQVILNLAVNARDAMVEGGTLTLRTHRVEGTLEVGSPGTPLLSTPMVRLTVSDTGTGIAPETRPHIFEPFYTTKEVGRGTGLGLSTVYGIVRQSGGRVEVESKLGEGSSFLVDLPVARSEHKPPDLGPPRAAARGGRETVLLVEDEDSVRGLIQRMLEGAGYRVLAAAGGDEAQQRWATSDTPVDLLVSDVMMRGLSGPALAERLCADQPQLKVLLISGFPGDHGRGETDERAFLAKPFSRETLLARVREVLDS